MPFELHRVNDLVAGRGVEEITVSGETALSHTSRGIYIGTGGNLEVRMIDGSEAVFTNIPDGSLLPLQVTHILDAATTAADIVAVY